MSVAAGAWAASVAGAFTGAASARVLPLWSLTLTVASMDRPTRSGLVVISCGSRRMRTGTRCTTLIQLPVAFCAGSSEKAAPVPALMPATVPW